MIIDGFNCEIFAFELSDNKDNHYGYELMSKNWSKAIAYARKHFEDEFGHKATHLERNQLNYPYVRNY